MMSYTPNVPPGPPPPPPPEDQGPGLEEIDRAIRRAERAQDKFQQELDALIDDLHEARDAIRENPLPGEGQE